MSRLPRQNRDASASLVASPACCASAGEMHLFPVKCMWSMIREYNILTYDSVQVKSLSALLLLLHNTERKLTNREPLNPTATCRLMGPVGPVPCRPVQSADAMCFWFVVTSPTFKGG